MDRTGRRGRALVEKEAGMRALITGSSGFLGRHFTAELLNRGYTVTGLDTKVTKSLDCRSYFQRVKNAARYDLAVHCAAVVGGRETIEGNPLATAVNLELDAAMFAWAARAKPGRVLYISSSAAYPVWVQNGGRGYQLSESMMNRTDPDEIYGWSKVMGEVLADKLRAAGVPVTVVRPFSGYGSDQDLSYPFPAFIERARQKQDPFEVWCGSCVRDFIHVDDVVNGALAVAESGTELPVNLCTGEPTSFNLLARLVMREAGYEGEVQERADKPTGVAYRVGDPTRMLGTYEPKVTLEEGIRRALDTGAG
jgi:nucleoside-diphosphate-sugar epimerase